MGYSVAAKALYVYNAVMETVTDPKRQQNLWTYKGEDFFADRGREQADAAMTGSVVSWRTGRTVGSFRIEADGTITRFPKVEKTRWKELQRIGLEKFDNRFGEIPVR